MTNHKQAEFNLQALKKRMNYYHKEIVNDAADMGMNVKTLEKLVEGKKIIVCIDCHTPNMYLKNKIIPSKEYDMYECTKCGKKYTKE